MRSGRLEAFSDAVIAIILTIMVLEMKVPHGTEFSDLAALAPVFISYVLSFIYIGIYWNNHHHLFQAVKHVDGVTLWANMHLLFWLSLLPFVTGWMGENHFAQYPVMLYGFVLLMCAVAYYLLGLALTRHPDHNAEVAKALGNNKKEILSIVLYISAIALAFVHAWIGVAVLALVAAIWLIPDSRIEKKIAAND